MAQTIVYAGTFSGCESLSSVELPSSAQSIGVSAFSNCSSLKSINIPKTVLSVNDAAFSQCSGLTSVMGLDATTHIGESAFIDNSALSSISRFDDDDPNHTFDQVGDYAFARTGLKKANLSLRSSSTDTWWGDYCFAECSALTDVNFLSTSYTSRVMFAGCESLSSVNFKNDIVSYVYPQVFMNCTGLKNITLPSQMWFISKEMFKGCSNLTSLNFKESDSPLINLVQDNAFNGCAQLKRIEFPTSLNSLKDFEYHCLSGVGATEIVFNGLSDDVLSTIYDRTGLQTDIHLNTQYEFRDDFAGYIRNYTLYERTLNADPIFSADNKYSKDQYDEQVEQIESTARSISTIIQLADQKNIPVVVKVTIDFDYTAKLKEPGVITRAYMMNDALKFTCNQHIDGAYEFRYKVCSFKLGTWSYSYDYIETASQQDVYQKSDKHQVSAVFIAYTLDLGRIVGIPDDDPSNPNTASINVHNITNGVLTKLRALSQITIFSRNSAFNVISNKMFDTSFGIDSPLFDYYNYGMVCVRHMLSSSTTPVITRATGIQYPLDDYRISSDAEAEKAQANIDAYSVEHPEVPKEDLPIISLIDQNDYAARVVNTKLMSLVTGVEPKPELLPLLSCDPQFNLYSYYPDKRQLSTFIAIENNIMQDWMNRSGLFGLCKDCSLWTSTGNHYEYVYDESKYVEYNPDRHESDKTTTTDFEIESGKWYYNIRELKDYADEKHLPIYMIYSSAGCNPCQHYLNNIHMNEDFQEWAKKQKFLLGRLEAEYPKGKDHELQFCEDVFARDALNYTKAGASQSTTPNAMDQFYEDAATGQTKLPPPCMIFYYKREDGTVVSHFDYSMHNIQSFLDDPHIGVEGTIQFIKSLCLYHFDNNDLTNPQFVVDAEKTFNKYDYNANPDNPYQISENAITLNRWTDLTTQTADGALAKMKNILSQVRAQSSSCPTYIGGCLWDQFDWIVKTFDCLALMDAESADKINSILETFNIQIGQKYFKLNVDGNDVKLNIQTPCTLGSTLYKYSFIEISNPS